MSLPKHHIVVVDDSAFREAFGPFENTPLDQAVRATVEWYRSH